MRDLKLSGAPPWLRAAPAIGLLDTALGTRFARHGIGAARFVSEVLTTEHGDAIAEILLAGHFAPRLVSAAVFDGRRPGSAQAVARGLDWLIERDTTLVNLSFGLREDRAVLRQACERAVAAGATLVASTPARGEAVYPAAYPGVLRITGDARCSPGQVSHLDSRQADFGACVGALQHHPGALGGGASLAAAHVTAMLGQWLAKGGRGDPRRHLEALCQLHGAERRKP